MREDYEVVRELALALWGDKDPRGFEVGSISKLSPDARGTTRFKYTIDNHLTDQEQYFFELMQERELVRFVSSGSRVHLTAMGQDFCHAVHDQKVWDRIKKYVIDRPFDLNEIKKLAAHERLVLSVAEPKSTKSEDIF